MRRQSRAPTQQLECVPSEAWDICESVCERHHLTLELMWGPVRVPYRICAARREAWDLLQASGYGYREISRWWGLDHKAVWVGVRKSRGVGISRGLVDGFTM